MYERKEKEGNFAIDDDPKVRQYQFGPHKLRIFGANENRDQIIVF
jgi:hypothetical protein